MPLEITTPSLQCSLPFFTGCGHCKNLAPAYEQVGDAFVGVSDVVIAKVDADSERDLGSRFEVQGFPTLKFFAKGGTTAVAYVKPVATFFLCVCVVLCARGVSMGVYMKYWHGVFVSVWSGLFLFCSSHQKNVLIFSLLVYIRYDGDRSADGIVNYINGQAGTRARVKKPVTATVDLDPSNFDRIALDSNKDVLVEFYAPCK